MFDERESLIAKQWSPSNTESLRVQLLRKSADEAAMRPKISAGNTFVDETDGTARQYIISPVQPVSGVNCSVAFQQLAQSSKPNWTP